MIRWILCAALLLFPFPAEAAAAQPTEQSGQAEQVELFDTDKQQVVRTFPNSSAFQQQAQRILDSVSGRVLDLNPSLENAMIVKIPLAPPKRLVHQASNLDTQITNMFVILPKSGGRQPWLILHTKQEETVVVEFSAKVDAIREQLHLPKVEKGTRRP